MAGKGDQGGRRRQSRTVHGTRADAEAAEAELRDRVGRWALEAAGGPPTLGRALHTWLNERPGRLAATTVAEYRRLAQRRIVPAFGDRPLGAITAPELARWYEQLEADGLSSNSVRQIHAVVRRCYRHAIAWGWCRYNPAAEAIAPRQTAQVWQLPTTEQVQALIAAGDAHGYGVGDAVRVAATIGLRRGELLGLHASAIDPSLGGVARSVVVSRTVVTVRGDGAQLKGYTKTLNHRLVPVPADLHQRLEAIAHRVSGPDVNLLDAGWLFSPDGTGSRFWHPDAFTHHWRAARAAAGLDSVRFHDLRHWCGSTMLDRGVPPATVAGILGHSLHTLERIYAHRIDATARHAADLMGGVLS